MVGGDKLTTEVVRDPSSIPQSVPEITTRSIRLPSGRTLVATPVFDTYWQFAVKRQQIFKDRVHGHTPPWTNDPVLAKYRFTNPYRASDRVSQYLIRYVLYEGEQTPEEIFFRMMLFKLFNSINTWEWLCAKLDFPTVATFHPDIYADVLDRLVKLQLNIYSAAYMMPNPNLGNVKKHHNHLKLINLMLQSELPNRIADASSLEAVSDMLKEFPSIGPFLSFQFAIDLNYSILIDFSEMDSVVAGPGAKNGIRKCFVDTGGLDDADLIRAISDLRESELARLGIKFSDLWGRPLQLIDLQNLFCEVDKYSRVVHPMARGSSSRSRIKQKFRRSSNGLPQWYPPKWKLNVPQFSIESREQISNTASDLFESLFEI